MKKFYIYIIIVVLVVFSSCEKVLEKPSIGAINPEIWDDEDAAMLYINTLYTKCFTSTMFQSLSSRSDESPGNNDYIYGTLTSDGVGDFGTETPYTTIREINIAIESLNEGSMDIEGKNKVLGQAYFLRAYKYWLLVRLYGGVPLVLTVQDKWADQLNIPRSKTSECIYQIVDDLDKAASMLPESWPGEEGRITKGGALAFKGRVLLYWASPQFNLGNKQERWQMAFEANQAAYDTCIKSGKELYSKFEDIFIEDNDERIIVRLYDYNLGETHRWENDCRPRAFGNTTGGGLNNPTWELVEAFPMKNGLSIDDPASGYDPERYWVNRDPRFYATIAYNGMTWAFAGFPNDTKQWHYYYPVISGTDTTYACIETPSATQTGFYCKKNIDESIPQDQVRETGTDWVELRLAEVMLNLAECANEIDQRDEAYDMLIQLRQRAGITPGADNLYGLQSGMDKFAMRKAIMLERQVELAFEGKRYWDLRRRNCFSGDLGSVMTLNGTQRHGLATILKPIPGIGIDTLADYFVANYQDIINIDTDFETYFSVEEYEVEYQDFVINFPQPLYNFFAIQQTVLDRSPAIKQTEGWNEGGFDPYAE
ncbi:MAG: RagB/SusD family nutrient uptake outer membrane protein [Bacteroidales bacterium]|nr:RagB/SusD family nutrient uptake outer membrane protein [Bacteroidales bacterium]